MDKKTWLYIGIGVLVLAVLYLISAGRNSGLALPTILGGTTKPAETTWEKLGGGVGSLLGKLGTTLWPDAGKSSSSGDYVPDIARADPISLGGSGV